MLSLQGIRPFISFNAPDVGDEEIKAMSEVIHSKWLGNGNVARLFEEDFSFMMGGGHAIAVSSCTVGLQIALRALGASDNQTVATTPLTFAATVNAILNSGCRPMFFDVDNNGCLDMDAVNRLSTSNFVVPVHYSGTICKFKKTNKIVIEDAAHAFGGDLPRSGEVQIFSFYPNKNITTGEGGMILTYNRELAKDMRRLASQGLTEGAWKRYGDGPLRNYAVETVGFKAAMPDILAAIGRIQLRRWPEISQKKKVIWKVYEKAFGKMPQGHSMHFYPLLHKNRGLLRQKLYEEGYGTGVHYYPLHLEPAYQFLDYEKGDFPNAERFGEQEISLPVSPHMSESDAWRIVEIIEGFHT